MHHEMMDIMRNSTASTPGNVTTHFGLIAPQKGERRIDLWLKEILIDG
ncbi:hypothetical protein [Paraburkholderia ribeironis]|nr:hypothetical protein [Paraburkholderia ribeironis]